MSNVNINYISCSLQYRVNYFTIDLSLLGLLSFLFFCFYSAVLSPLNLLFSNSVISLIPIWILVLVTFNFFNPPEIKKRQIRDFSFSNLNPVDFISAPSGSLHPI